MFNKKLKEQITALQEKVEMQQETLMKICPHNVYVAKDYRQIYVLFTNKECAICGKLLDSTTDKAVAQKWKLELKRNELKERIKELEKELIIESGIVQPKETANVDNA